MGHESRPVIKARKLSPKNVVASARLALLARAILFAVAVVTSIASRPGPAYATGLDCPDASQYALVVDDTQIRRMTNGNETDFANEIDNLIAQMRQANPTGSNDTIADALIGAYCRVVAQMASASSTQKWQYVRQFDRVLVQRLVATTMPGGTLIIADVPLPPVIYQKLSQQAMASGQRPTELMSSILINAAREQ